MPTGAPGLSNMRSGNAAAGNAMASFGQSMSGSQPAAALDLSWVSMKRSRKTRLRKALQRLSLFVRRPASSTSKSRPSDMGSTASATKPSTTSAARSAGFFPTGSETKPTTAKLE